MMAKQTPIRASKIEPMQSFSLGKRRKKRDGWLMIFTWLVVFVVVGLTGAWWWQNHKESQDDLVPMTDQNSSSGDSGQSIPLGESSGDSAAPAAPDESNTTSDNSAASAPASAARPPLAAIARPPHSRIPPAMPWFRRARRPWTTQRLHLRPRTRIPIPARHLRCQ